MLAEVFAEERSFSVQHVFLPAIIYYYTQNIFVFYTIIYLFETFEYLFGQFDHTWGEDPGDSLVGDILMATLGMLAIRQFRISSKPLWYIGVHVGVLIIACVVTVKVLWDDIMWAYVFFGLIVSIMGVLINIEWAVFTLVNVVIIAGIATRGFNQPFSHTPVAASISLLGTTALILVYKWCNSELFRL